MILRFFCPVVLVLAGVFAAIGQSPSGPVYGILVDNTGSLRLEIANERALAKEIVATTNGSAYSLFRFETDRSPGSKNAVFMPVVNCSHDRDLVLKEIAGLYTLGGQTTLSEAIKTAAERLQVTSNGCGDSPNRNLIVISDGDDRTSSTTLDELVEFLKGSGIKVFAVGLVDHFWDAKGQVTEAAQAPYKNYLERITSATGGKAVFPEKGAAASDVIKKLFEAPEKSVKGKHSD